jgi:hypothetical protein
LSQTGIATEVVNSVATYVRSTPHC